MYDYGMDAESKSQLTELVTTQDLREGMIIVGRNGLYVIQTIKPGLVTSQCNIWLWHSKEEPVRKLIATAGTTFRVVKRSE